MIAKRRNVIVKKWPRLWGDIMSLRDMVMPTEKNPPNNIKHAERASLNADIERFLKRGKEIQKIPMGKSGLRDGVLIIPECDSPISFTTADFSGKRKKGSVANHRDLPLHVRRNSKNGNGSKK